MAWGTLTLWHRHHHHPLLNFSHNVRNHPLSNSSPFSTFLFYLNHLELFMLTEDQYLWDRQAQACFPLCQRLIPTGRCPWRLKSQQHTSQVYTRHPWASGPPHATQPLWWISRPGLIRGRQWLLWGSGALVGALSLGDSGAPLTGVCFGFSTWPPIWTASPVKYCRWPTVQCI